MKKIEKKSMGYRLRFARNQAGLRQQSLADKLEISKRTLINWEQNQSAPSDPMVNKIAKITSCCPDQLLGFFPIESLENENKRLQKELLEAKDKIIALLEADCHEEIEEEDGKGEGRSKTGGASNNGSKPRNPIPQSRPVPI